jgi:catechol 2,3-dioxygenase-like lactoylglutathione lyase family enzyme
MPRLSSFGYRFILAVLLLLVDAGRRLAFADPIARADSLVRSVGCIGLTVSDLDRSIDFYDRVLSFQKVSEIEFAGEAYEQLAAVFGVRARTARLKLGAECIELTEYLAPRGRPPPLDARSNDRWFQHIAIVVTDMNRAYQALRQARVEHASSGPQRLPDWNPNAGGIQAFYFRDPDRHVLEVLQFPPGKGDPRWQRAAKREQLFLGIDHTAIVVADTEASLQFYRDSLALRVAGNSENWGTEQEHLNNVFGARLRITTLRSGEGPGIELLEYLTPRDGRPMPTDEHANDLIHWQTTLVTANLDRAVDSVRSRRLPLVSSGIVSLPDKRLGFSRAFLARDPDGHVMAFSTQ